MRAAQSLTLLSHALKLSLLLSLEPVDSQQGEDRGSRTTLNQEALELIARARHERAECLRLLQACGVGTAPVEGAALAAAAPGAATDPVQAEAQDLLTTPPLEQLISGAGPLADATQSMPIGTAAPSAQPSAPESAVPSEEEEEDEEMEEVPVGT